MFGDIRKARIIAFSGAFIGLISLGSWISIPFIPVPLTLQTLFVLLAGSIMHRDAVIPVTLYILLGALGLPVFHNGVAGIGILLGPTGGYLVGFIPAALITGFAYEQSSGAVRILGLAAAMGALYISGIAWLVCSTGIGIFPAIVVGVIPFIPGDAVKVLAVFHMKKQIP